MKKLIFILIKLYSIHSLIVFPFRINGYNPKEKEKFNITDYINQYLIVDIFTTIEIGSPPQKVTTLITPDENVFSLSSEICEKKSLDYISDYSIVSKNGLDLNKIKQYNEFSINNITNYQDEGKNIGIITDNIYLYNTTYLSSQPLEWSNKKGNIDSKIKIDNFEMIIQDYKKYKKLCGIIGIGSPRIITGGLLKLRNLTTFIDTLKKYNIINSYSWTFKLYHKEEGRLIIGGLPHEYENDYKRYNQSKYKSINSFLSGDVDFPWSIRFDSINFVNSKNETIYIQQGLRSLLAPNLGFIISEEAYRNLILENYFQDLINKKICILERTSKTNFNRANYNFGTSGIYEVIHCNKSLIDAKDHFPSINFEHKEQNIIFSLSFPDLFRLIEDRYFFLVIFPENYYRVKSSFWYLGLPFYQAYQMVFNFDSKTIGVYEQQKKIKTENKDININKQKKKIRFKRTILEIIFGFILVFSAYFIGKTINEQRKKRANELTDDYEYYSNPKKDINDINNEISDNKNTKGNLEMTSSIGI